MAEELLARFSDFRGGEYGLAGPRLSAKNQWTGRNVIPWSDGALAPRYGAKEYVPATTPSGRINVLGWTPTVTNPTTQTRGRIWYCDDTGEASYFHPNSLTVSTYAHGVGWAGGPTAASDYVNFGPDQTYVIDPVAGMFRLTHDTRINSPISGAPSGYCIERFGERFYAANIDPFGTPAPNRVRYTNAATGIQWPSGQFFDVPNLVPIVSLIAQRDHLIIIQQDYSVWVFTGVPGINGVLRRAGSLTDGNAPVGALPITPQTFTRANGSQTVYGATFALNGVFPSVPLRFGGGQLEQLDAMPIGLPLSSRLRTVAHSDLSTEGIVFVGHEPADGTPGYGLTYFDGRTWSRHALPTVAEWALSSARAICAGPDGEVLFTGGTSICSWTPSGQPYDDLSGGVERDDDAGSVVIGEFTTAEVVSDKGFDILPRAVVVNFRSWPDRRSGAGGAVRTTNTFDVQLVPIATESGDDPAALNALSFSEASAGATKAPRYRSRSFGFGPLRGKRFAVKISNLCGVSIDEVLVYGTVDRQQVP